MDEPLEEQGGLHQVLITEFFGFSEAFSFVGPEVILLHRLHSALFVSNLILQAFQILHLLRHLLVVLLRSLLYQGAVSLVGIDIYIGLIRIVLTATCPVGEI